MTKKFCWSTFKLLGHNFSMISLIVMIFSVRKYLQDWWLCVSPNRRHTQSCVMPSIKRCKRWSHLVTCPARKLLYIHFITFISQHRYQTKNTEHLKWAPQCLGFLTCVFWTLSLKILFTCLPIVFLLMRWFGNFKCNFLSLICMNS